MDGLHVVANLSGCRGDARYLVDVEALRAFCVDSVSRSGLTLVGELFHQFAGGGVTGAVILAESHLAVHTWPEIASVALDVYVCNFTRDNDARARRIVDDLIALFCPEEYARHEVPRGRQHLHESLNPDYGFFIRSEKRLEELHTGLQSLEVHETPQFGRLLRLDGCFMTSEREEFVYHENLIHPAASAHPEPKRVLVVGGGDGGAAEEALKHPSVEQVTLVELDARVIEIARKHFAAIHRGAFESPRLRLVIEDGLRFVAGTSERFDLIFLDLPDPIGPATALYEEPFFRDCRRALAPGGALALHLGSPVAHPERVRAHFGRLASVFALVRLYAMFIPLYGCLWSMAIGSDSLDPLAVPAEEIDRRIAKRGIARLQYYNGAVHHAIFALPNFVRDLTAGAQPRLPRRARAAAGAG